MNEETLEGKIVFELINKGSRSEHIAPVLYLMHDNEKYIKKTVSLVNLQEPAFKYDSFVKYDGKYVKVQGRHFFGRFIVDTIQEVIS